MSNNAPTESKVVVGTLGGGTGYILGQVATWAIGVLFFSASADAANQAGAIAAVPTYLASVIQGGLVVGLTFAGGWFAHHTVRTEDVQTALAAFSVPAVPDTANSPHTSDAPPDNSSLLNTDGTENAPITDVPDVQPDDDGSDPVLADTANSV